MDLKRQSILSFEMEKRKNSFDSCSNTQNIIMRQDSSKHLVVAELDENIEVYSD